MIQLSLMNNVDTTFHKGDRVKLLLWEDIDFYGTILNAEWFKTGENNLVEDDDGFISWYENRWLKKVEMPKPIVFNGVCLYPDGHIVSPFKDKYMIEDLPTLEKEAKDCETKGYTGYHYSVLMACIKLLKDGLKCTK